MVSDFWKIINIIFCSTHVLRSRLIDGEACKQCKVSLVVSSVMGGWLSLGHALKNAI